MTSANLALPSWKLRLSLSHGLRLVRPLANVWVMRPELRPDRVICEAKGRWHRSPDRTRPFDRGNRMKM